jgi:hypothetical protein
MTQDTNVTVMALTNTLVSQRLDNGGIEYSMGMQCADCDLSPYHLLQVVSVPTGTTERIVCEQCGYLRGLVAELPPHLPVYVNAYRVTQAYGGPEEGDWWYDVGEPLASVPIHTEEQEDTVRNLLHTVLAPQFEDARPRTSATGDGEDLVITVERHLAAPFPATRPHYE